MSNSYEELKLLVIRAKQIVKNFEDTLGWNENPVSVHNAEVESSICPYNDSHIVPQKSLDNHLRKCKWRNYGYTEKEVKEIIDAESTSSSGLTVSLDEVVSKVAPETLPLRNHEIYVSTLNREKRLQVYDEIISQLKHNKQNLDDPFLYKDLDEKSQQGSGSTEKTNIELVKELRDHKRRRQSYRAKNVHVTKRSQTEVLRDILSIHMEELRSRWNPEIRSTSSEIQSRDQSTSKPSDRERSREAPHESRRERVVPKTATRLDEELPRDDYDRRSERDRRARDDRDYSREHKRERRSHDRDHHRHHKKLKKHKRSYDDDEVRVKPKKHKKSSH